MTVAKCDKKECSRCHGKGFGSWVSDGGRCYKCFGTGFVLIGEAKKNEEVNAIKKHLQEIEDSAAEIKQMMVVETSKYRLSKLAAELESLRVLWVSVNKKLN